MITGGPHEKNCQFTSNARPNAFHLPLVYFTPSRRSIVDKRFLLQNRTMLYYRDRSFVVGIPLHAVTLKITVHGDPFDAEVDNFKERNIAFLKTVY